MNSSVNTKRNVGIDCLKALAIIGVITIHTSSAGLNGNPVLSFNWTSSLFWGSLTRASVPIFLMCSGALLLNPAKELPLKKLYFKNLLRLIVAMFVWAIAYKVYHLAVAGTLGFPALLQSLKETLLFKQEFHLYYLHIMIIVYLLLPITRLFVKNATKKDLIYALVIWFILGIIYPTVRPYHPFNLLDGIPAQWLINMTYASVGYGILGHYLITYPLSRKISALLAGVGFASGFGLTLFMSARHGELYQNFLEGMSVGVALLAAGIFGLVYGIKDKISGKFASLCKGLSKASFCVFLVHVFVIYLFEHLNISVNAFPCIVSVPVFVLLNLAISFAVYFVLSKIPLVNKWLI